MIKHVKYLILSTTSAVKDISAKITKLNLLTLTIAIKIF